MSSELPPELWLRIADFIPDEALYRLSSVNHLFLDSSEDRKYKDLVLDDDQPQILMQKLRKLRDDPKTASRVRSIEIHPRALRSAWLKYHLPQKRSRNLFSMYLHNTLKDSSNLPPNPSESPFIADLLTSLSYAKNIESCTIHWPDALQDEVSFCIPSLVCMWRAIGAERKLKALSIDMPLRYQGDLLAQTLPHGWQFAKLEKLDLRFSACGTRSWNGENSTQAADLALLAEFIRFHSSTLISLSLATSCPKSTLSASYDEHIDFSPFFDHLIIPGPTSSPAPLLPFLTHFTLDLLIDATHFSDPAGLISFLKVQTDAGELRTLKLRDDARAYLSSFRAGWGDVGLAARGRDTKNVQSQRMPALLAQTAGPSMMNANHHSVHMSPMHVPWPTQAVAA